jgi:hypothetical protein
VAEKFHAFSDRVPERFERDMGYNEKEFFRVLPAAIGEYQHTVTGDTVHIRHLDNDQALELQITPLPDRRLGLMRIQHIDVQFSFSSMTQQQRNQFMYRFDRRFQRGGG